MEDNCDALGSLYTIDGETRFTGTWGDIGTSSFYPPHHMTMGEGGCVYTNNPLLDKLIKSFFVTGDVIVCARPEGTICAEGVLTDSLENFRRGMITNTSIVILDTI